MTEGLEFSVKYRAFVKHSDASGLYVSCCPLLDIVSQGRDEGEARASLDDAVRLFVTHCWRRGNLNEVLARRGLVEAPASSSASVADAGDSGEYVSVRPIEAARAWWEGHVLVSAMIASEHNRKAGDGACKQ